MKSLSDPLCKQEILTRVANVRAESERQWGQMDVSQMICHLNDSFLGIMGDKAMEIPGGFSIWPLMKWVALYAPMKWPQGVPTRLEFDQLNGGGTRPSQFDRDKRGLIESIEKFTQQPRTFHFKPHPMFRKLSERDWMRWGYLHIDHHLRQFGH